MNFSNDRFGINKSKEELIAIILRKDDVERRLQNQIKVLMVREHTFDGQLQLL